MASGREPEALFPHPPEPWGTAVRGGAYRREEGQGPLLPAAWLGGPLTAGGGGGGGREGWEGGSRFSGNSGIAEPVPPAFL